MRTPLLGLMASALLLAAAPAAWSAPPPTMSTNTIDIGMKGTCRTVFRGTKIEPFDFEVLGLMKNMLGPGQDVILTRLRSPNAEYTGVVAGMSGSPCYIDGKLVGALAYRFGQFTKEAIAGITPIQNMLDIFNLPGEKPQTALAPDFKTALANLPLSAGQLGDIRPIATPLSFAGFDPRVIARFQPDLEKMGFQPVLGSGSSGGGTAAGINYPTTMEPGGAIAGQLVRGDMSIDGTGTVSYVDGKRVLAFGHPFFNQGYINIPMASAYVLNILVSEAGSYKMAQSGLDVGAITQDRLTAIYGEMGRKAPMIPVSMMVQDPHSPNDPKQVKLEVARNPVFTPMFVAMGVNSVLQSRLNFNNGGNLRLTGSLRTNDRTIKLDNFYSVNEREDVTSLAAMDIASKIFTLWNNPFKEVQIQGLDLNFEIHPQSQVATIQEVWVDSNELRPGDKVNVNVRLRPYRKPEIVRSLKLEIPPETPTGQILLLVSSGTGVSQLEQTIKTEYPSYEALVSDLEKGRRNDQLSLVLISEDQGLSQNSQLLPKLPPSLLDLLNSPRVQNKTVSLARSIWKEFPTDTGYDIQGQGVVRLLISPQGHSLFR